MCHRWGKIMDFETFCLNLSKERIKKGLSAYELSLRLGKDPSYINKLENGKINVSLKTIIEISECLNVPITKFFE